MLRARLARMASPAQQATWLGLLPDRPVGISAYDPAWPIRYEEERATLEETTGELAAGGIHHVGSTAVPGVDAEPVIDILVGVGNGDAAQLCCKRLAELDYLCVEGDGKRLCKPHPNQRDYEVWVTEAETDRYAETLAFRDFLRTHPQAAIGFAGMKRDLASRYANDRRAYAVAKLEIFQTIACRLPQRSANGHQGI